MHHAQPNAMQDANEEVYLPRCGGHKFLNGAKYNETISLAEKYS
jgi:hypothetical protein